jgi:hypothetical protein
MGVTLVYPSDIPARQCILDQQQRVLQSCRRPTSSGPVTFVERFQFSRTWRVWRTSTLSVVRDDVIVLACGSRTQHIDLDVFIFRKQTRINVALVHS